jgi:hypothetical protein
MTRRRGPRCSGGFSLAGLTPILVFMKSTRTAAVAAAIVLVGAAASTATALADPAPAPPPPAPGPPLPGPEPPPAPKTTIDADGTYAVGTDIQPGVYSSAGPVGDGACYWKRVNGSAIVDNALTKKAQIVQIEATDTSFTTNECQAWQLTDAPVPVQGPGDLLGQLAQLAPIIARNSGPPPGN